MKTIRIHIILMFVLIAQLGLAQNHLQVRVNVNAENEKLGVVLHSIEEQGGFVFAYNADLFDVNSTVSAVSNDCSVKFLIDNIFNGELTGKVVGNHVILTRKKGVQKKDVNIRLSGRVTDANNNPLDSVIVFALARNTATLTKNDGTFNISIQSKKEWLSLNIAIPDIIDSVLHVRAESQSLNIKLFLPEREVRQTEAKIAEINSIVSPRVFTDYFFVEAFVPISTDNYYVSEHLKVYINRPLQLSFLPFVGVNGRESGLVTNNFSINILAGYSRELKGLEIGSLANITRRNANGMQVSGLFNVVGANSNGLQVAGIINTTVGNVNGVQLSGIMNTTNGNINGLQAAGIGNVARGNDRAIQLAGIFNVSRDLYSKKQGGNCIQLSGVLNFDKGNIVRFQASGMGNFARKVEGIQVAGILNATKELTGIQIGLVNYAATIHQGVQIGLLNFVKNGTHDLAFYATPQSVNLSYRSGGKTFYSLYDFGTGAEHLSLGYGLGAKIPFTKRFSINLNTLMSAIIKEADGGESAGSLLQFQGELNFNITKHFGLICGPIYSIYNPNKTINIDYLSKDGLGFMGGLKIKL